MLATQLVLQTGEDTFMMPKMSAHAGQAVALAPEPPSPNGTALLYKPISSVWEGSDSGLIEVMLNFYPTIPPTPILDATYNAGRMWKGSKRRVTSMDIDPQYKPDIIGDNREMKGIRANRFGVVVYDPPHVGPQGRDKSKKRFDVDLGTTIECGKEQDWNLNYCMDDPALS